MIALDRLKFRFGTLRGFDKRVLWLVLGLPAAVALLLFIYTCSRTALSSRRPSPPITSICQFARDAANVLFSLNGAHYLQPGTMWRTALHSRAADAGEGCARSSRRRYP